MTAKMIVIVTLMIQSAIFAQDTQLNLTSEKMSQYLSEIFGTDFEQSRPHAAEAFKTLIANRILLRYEPEQQYEKYPKLSSFPLNNKNNSAIPVFNGADFDIQQFNPLRYGLDFFSPNTQVARLDDTPYLLIVLPQ